MSVHGFVGFRSLRSATLCGRVFFFFFFWVVTHVGTFAPTVSLQFVYLIMDCSASSPKCQPPHYSGA